MIKFPKFKPCLSCRMVVAGAVAYILAGAVLAGGAHADGLSVKIDQTVPIRLERPAATIVVGNPAVADITAQNNKLFFVVGRTMGTTNVVAVDESGNQIANVVVNVTSPDKGQVMLHRSTARVSYSCAPNCERSQMPGDARDPYKDLTEANNQKLDVAKKGRMASSGSN